MRSNYDSTYIGKSLYLSSCVINIQWADFCRSVGLREAYLYRCVQANYQISHSQRLLWQALKLSSLSMDYKSFDYLSEHIIEELGHEAWTSNDLTKTKEIMRKTVKISKATRNLVKHQYSSLKKGDYHSIYGYALALEGFPGRASYWEQFSQDSGIPVAAFESPIKHANKDIEHSDSLFLHLENLDLNQEQVTNIISHAQKSMRHIAEIFSMQEMLPKPQIAL